MYLKKMKNKDFYSMNLRQLAEIYKDNKRTLSAIRSLDGGDPAHLRRIQDENKEILEAFKTRKQTRITQLSEQLSLLQMELTKIEKLTLDNLFEYYP
nr:MAG TPA: hypothetical protein [Caudoviricetes sp.]